MENFVEKWKTPVSPGGFTVKIGAETLKIERKRENLPSMRGQTVPDYEPKGRGFAFLEKDRLKRVG